MAVFFDKSGSVLKLTFFSSYLKQVADAVMTYKQNSLPIFSILISYQTQLCDQITEIDLLDTHVIFIDCF